MATTLAPEISEANQEFWNELCGTTLAGEVGIRDHSLESLRRFDEAFLKYYPYLLKHVDLLSLKGRKVLEIGLGFGTLGQKIAEAGADYMGLDIANGPVQMMIHRLRQNRLPGHAIRGSMLDCPVETESMDHVVSIGCFHHTGDVQRCLDHTHRVLKPGGTATIMVYNQFSYRQWGKWPGLTFRAWLAELGLQRRPAVTDAQRKAYDANSLGHAAPETVFLSIKELRRMTSRFSRASFTKENCGGTLDISMPLFWGMQGSVRISMPREETLDTMGKKLGLDIYLKAIK